MALLHSQTRTENIVRRYEREILRCTLPSRQCIKDCAGAHWRVLKITATTGRGQYRAPTRQASFLWCKKVYRGHTITSYPQS